MCSFSIPRTIRLTSTPDIKQVYNYIYKIRFDYCAYFHFFFIQLLFIIFSAQGRKSSLSSLCDLLLFTKPCTVLVCSILLEFGLVYSLPVPVSSVHIYSSPVPTSSILLDSDPITSLTVLVSSILLDSGPVPVSSILITFISVITLPILSVLVVNVPFPHQNVQSQELHCKEFSIFISLVFIFLFKRLLFF